MDATWNYPFDTRNALGVYDYGIVGVVEVTHELLIKESHWKREAVTENALCWKSQWLYFQ